MFPSASCEFINSISGNITRRGQEIECAWRIEGDLDRVNWQGPETGRHDNLWQHTCLELFIGQPGQLSYTEFNLSPAGGWNAYHFDDVRLGMARTDQFMLTSTSLGTTPTARIVRAQLGTVNTSANALQVGISAVVEGTDGSLHYYALAHESGKPDFHLRANHLLYLQEE